MLRHVQLFVTPWTTARQAPLSTEFSSGLQFPSPGDLPNPGISPRSPLLQSDSLLSQSPGKPLQYKIKSFGKKKKKRDILSPPSPSWLRAESTEGLFHHSPDGIQTSGSESDGPAYCFLRQLNRKSESNVSCLEYHATDKVSVCPSSFKGELGRVMSLPPSAGLITG